MSEPLARPRPSMGDVHEIRTGPAHPGHEDPLAELARLVGRDDPFRDIFPARPQGGAAIPARPVSTERETIERRPEPYGRSGDAERSRDQLHEDADISEPAESQYGSADAGYETYRADPAAPGGELPRDSLRFPALPSARSDYADPRYDEALTATQHHEAPPLHADLWAEGVQEAPATDPGELAPLADENDAAEAGQSRRRTLIVLAAVVALTGGGLAATFLVRGGSNGAGQQAATAPTIMADSAPTKVQPPETANPSTGGDGSTALLEKSASDNVANAKVVNAQEQPVDLNQLPKPTAPATTADASATGLRPASTFPEPRKVKTILIRPDGSVVGESEAAAPNPAALATPGVVMPTAAAPPPETPAAAPAAIAKPATPKSTVRVSATPKPAPTPRATAKPKPVETAAVDPTRDGVVATSAPAAASTGAYAVQLAAPTSEDEAKSTSARLQKKFADALAGHTPSIRKADSGSKSVYRVRVGNLSQEDAKALCTKLQGSGGSCFVVHN